jgi:hypothetical protein
MTGDTHRGSILGRITKPFFVGAQKFDCTAGRSEGATRVASNDDQQIAIDCLLLMCTLRRRELWPLPACQQVHKQRKSIKRTIT